MGNKIEYIRCPRCELNYIDKREKMCKVCQNELQAKGNRELTDEEIKELNICPVCRTNYLIDDEDICAECLAEKEVLENSEINLSDDDQMDEKDERSENWRAYVENDDAETPEEEFGDLSTITSEDDVIDDSDLDLDMDKDEDFDEEFDEEFDDDDDFDESFDDLGYDDDEDDDDDDDDDFDDEDEE